MLFLKAFAFHKSTKVLNSMFKAAPKSVGTMWKFFEERHE